MGIMVWFYKFGLPGAITKDLLKKYLVFKRGYPHDSEGMLLQRVWDFWLILNEEAIEKEDGIDKRVRLKIVKDRYIAGEMHRTLLDIYRDVLYIEAEITSEDIKIYDDTMKVFIKEANKHGLDYSEDYLSMKRIIDLCVKR